jgi:tRNA-2-methylthio-N6-dimethylallyladenosine synthase
LRVLDALDGLERIRFLTSHPNYMGGELLDAVAALPKVMPHIEVPVQAGDDEVLARMRRGYTVGTYRDLIGTIRARLPGCSIATDIIVGFPGESEQQFAGTYDLLADLQLDVAHLAMYSPRPQTASARRMTDDVPHEEKLRRLKALDALQEGISRRINEGLIGAVMPVLVEGTHKGKWRGRTPTNKLVFFADDSRNWAGETARVRVVEAGAWSMQAMLAGDSRETLPAHRRELLPMIA